MPTRASLPLPIVLLFLLLSLCWGSSFFWIKIALTELTPYILVLCRVILGALGLSTAVVLSNLLRKGRRAKFTLKHHLHLMVMSFLGVTLPFLFLSQGETQISSSLTGLLNGTVPFFTVIFGHFILHDEPLRPQQFLGMVVGFFGLMILFDPFHSQGSTLWGAFLVVLASAFYGMSAIYLRRFLPKQYALNKAAYMMNYAAIFLALGWLLSTLMGGQAVIPATLAITMIYQNSPRTLVAVTWLGLVGSCLAYLIYYHLIGALGAGRASMVMYVCPIVAVILGAVMLQESLGLSFYLGGGLTLAGVFISSRR